MARYVLLEFDDNKEAEAFVASLQDGYNFYGFPAPADVDDGDQVAKKGEIVYRDADPEKVRVRALFAKPVNFCQCQPRPENHVKGSKLGWYICRQCAKAVPGTYQHPRNLLDPEDLPPEKRELYLGVWEGSPKSWMYASKHR